jgi:inward rectifier potassium channel
MKQSLPRRVRLTRTRGATIIGQQRRWNDLYHVLLTMPWWAFFAVMALTFVTLNAAFAGLYLLDPNGIANARPGSFADHFFFSVETLGTLGYGVMAPQSLYAHSVVTAEAFVSLVNVAIATGLIFARFSRPTARVLFSKVAVISRFEGVPTLMFRVANQRGNQILEADVSLTLAFRTTTREGTPMRRFQELRVMKSRSPLFALSWLIMHPIDETSPLWNATPESLAATQSEVLVMISGNDQSFAQRIFARHSYLPEEIVWGGVFVDVLTMSPEGELLVDYRHFHDYTRELA